MATTSGSGVPWVRVARVSRGMTQGELAEAVGLAQPTICHIELGRTQARTGVRRVLPAVQQAIADALDYEVRDLFPPEGKRSRNRDLCRLVDSMNHKRRMR